MERFVHVIAWWKEHDRLVLAIRGERYVYSCSYYVKEKFCRMLKHNQGQALAYLKGQSQLLEV